MRTVVLFSVLRAEAETEEEARDRLQELINEFSGRPGIELIRFQEKNRYEDAKAWVIANVTGGNALESMAGKTDYPDATGVLATLLSSSRRWGVEGFDGYSMTPLLLAHLIAKGRIPRGVREEAFLRGTQSLLKGMSDAAAKAAAYVDSVLRQRQTRDEAARALSELIGGSSE